MIIIEEHKLIGNLGNDLPFVRKVINESSSFFYIMMVSVAVLQTVSQEPHRGWVGGRRARPGARGLLRAGVLKKIRWAVRLGD